MAKGDPSESIKQEITALLTGRKLAVLSTECRGQPYASLMAFAGTEDLRYLVFATACTTRKFANLTENPRVALLINSAANTETDFHRAASVTATGTAEVLSAEGASDYLKLYLEKHPHLKAFAMAPTTELVRVSVDCYYLVTRFQNVTELHIKP